MSRMTDPVGRVLGGRYRILSPLGSGASAHVYLADDVRLRRRVAVKVLHAALAGDQSFLRRFRAEAHAAAALSHPHILAVYDWSGDDDTPFLVTEYLAGGSLRSMLDAGHRLTTAQALVVGLETVRALDHAHRQGFVHRDIKPANLLFGDEARLRVADFGLARAIAEAGWTEPAGAVLGTARYASPEQVRGHSVDGRSDVYSLALVLIEAVTGAVPFSADTTIATLMARLERSLEVPGELGPLAPILVAAGTIDPAERIDAATFGTRLVGAAEQLARPEPLPLAPTPPPAAAGSTGDGTLIGSSASSGRVGRSVPGSVAPLPPAQFAPPAGPPAGPPSSAGVGAAGTDATEIGSAAVVTASRLAADHDPTSVMRVPGDLARPPWPDGSGAPMDPWPGASTSPPLPLSAGDRSARRLLLGAVVVAMAVTIGVVGSWAYLRSQVPSHTVPAQLVGAQEGEISDIVGGFGWKIDSEKDYYDHTDKGEIVRTSPEPGTALREGETLRLYVSLGPPLVRVPQDLAGMSQDEARARLAADGAALVPHFEARPSKDVPAGIVIGLGDNVADQVPKGSTVSVLVSAGDTLEVPDLEGERVGRAVAELQRLGFEVKLRRVKRGDGEVGEVIRTEPGAGEEVDPGSTVVVVVAGGFDLTETPSG